MKKQTQIVVNVEQSDKVKFNEIKAQYNLSDKELFAVMMKAQDKVGEEVIKTIIEVIVIAKQAAKVQVKIDRLQAKIDAAKAEIATSETELEPLIVIE